MPDAPPMQLNLLDVTGDSYQVGDRVLVLDPNDYEIGGTVKAFGYHQLAGGNLLTYRVAMDPDEDGHGSWDIYVPPHRMVRQLLPGERVCWFCGPNFDHRSRSERCQWPDPPRRIYRKGVVSMPPAG